MFILTSCSKEETRHIAFSDCVDSINKSFSKEIIHNNFYVFDNNSLIQETKEIIKKNFNDQNIHFANENVGLWSAVYNFINSKKSQKFKYILSIESDWTFYDVHKLNEIVSMFEKKNNVSCCRLKEFDVDNLKKFSKQTNPGYRSSVTLRNIVTGKDIEFKKLDDFENIYRTNFHAVLPCLYKKDCLKTVLDHLAKINGFTELDFMQTFENLVAEDVCLVQGGIFYEDPRDKGYLTGSWSQQSELQSVNYFNSRYNNNIIASQEII